MRCSPPSLSALTLLVLTALPAPSRADQDTPYNGSFGLTLTSVKPLPKGGDRIKGVLAGEATFLGPFTGTVEYHVFPDGSFVGTATKVAADGDQLTERLAGTLTATGSVGAFVVTGGTRRFKHASGSGTFVSTWTSTTTAVVTFAGSASYRPPAAAVPRERKRRVQPGQHRHAQGRKRGARARRWLGPRAVHGLGK